MADDQLPEILVEGRAMGEDDGEARRARVADEIVMNRELQRCTE